jgi:hypothetical protein
VEGLPSPPHVFLLFVCARGISLVILGLLASLIYIFVPTLISLNEARVMYAFEKKEYLPI